MSENYDKIELIDFIECLRNENNLLIKQLSLSQKCGQLLDSYRNCLNLFNNNCNCDQKVVNKKLVKHLDCQYRSLIDEDMKNCGLNPENNEINISFNKNTLDSNPSQTTPEPDLVDTNMAEVSDNRQSDFKNILQNIFDNNLKQLQLQDSDYGLKYLKTETEDMCEHKCVWVKCGTSYPSIASLNQHIRTAHFEISTDYYYENEFTVNNSQIVIDCEQIYEINKLSEQKPYVCDWIGCEVRYRTDRELETHKKSIHYVKEDNYDYFESNKVIKSGLKPLTIHSSDPEYRYMEKPFQCDQCCKGYTRKDRLKTHIKTAHNSSYISIQQQF